MPHMLLVEGIPQDNCLHPQQPNKHLLQHLLQVVGSYTGDKQLEKQRMDLVAFK